MTLAEFRASMKLMTPQQYEADYGHGIMDGAKPGDMVRCYDSGAWILYRAATGDHWMHLEAEEYETAGDYDLQDMEETLYRWTHPADQTFSAMDSGQERTPGTDADHEEMTEWAGRMKNEHRAKLAAALLIGFLDPENGRPDTDAAKIIADEIGPDYTLSLAQMAAEIHRYA